MCQTLKWITAFILFYVMIPSALYGQIEEPPLRPIDQPRSPYDEDVRNGLSFNVVVNNYGFGIGGEFKRILSRDLEGTLTMRMAGLRDVSEQTFTDFFFGQQVVPNKYRRAFSFPLTVGLRQRVFASQISDNYRFYVSGDMGPVLAFSYPYFDDILENGHRLDLPQFNYVEPVNDLFTGLGDGTWHLGMAGEIRLSLDIGENFSRLTSVQFGFMMYYFPDGIQIMQPFRPVLNQNRQQGEFPYEYTDPDDHLGTMVMEPFFDPQKFFGTPQISFIFGRLW